MIAFQLQVTLNDLNHYENIDYTKLPLALLLRLKWDMY